MHYNPVRPLDWDPRARAGKARRINRIVHDIVVDLGGSISAEHGIGRSRLAELEHYKAPLELGMMRAVKHALDPARHHEPRQDRARLTQRPAHSDRPCAMNRYGAAASRHHHPRR